MPDGMNYGKPTPAPFNYTVELEILDKMTETLSDPNHWIKGTRKVRRAGSLAFCVLGALMLVTSDDDPHPRDVVYTTLNSVAGPQGIVRFNDDPRTTHAAVMGVLKLARDKLVEIERKAT
jgi:hypothetical protein